MMNLFDKVKAVCTLMVMGLGVAAYSAAPTVTSVTAQQRYPWNGLVDIIVTFNGTESDVAKANCAFAATDSATKTALATGKIDWIYSGSRVYPGGMLTTFVPGKGYWVYAERVVTIRFDER